MQPQLPFLLHVALGEAEQPLPALPAGVVHTTHGEIVLIVLYSTPGAGSQKIRSLSLFKLLSRSAVHKSNNNRFIAGTVPFLAIKCL